MNLDVGRYRLHEQLPASRSTFLATRADSSTRYVVKTVVGDFEDAHSRDAVRLLQQKGPNLPHLCSIVEVGRLPYLVYAVAPFLEGMNLARLIRLVHERDSSALSIRGAHAASFLVSELALAYQELRSTGDQGEEFRFSPDAAFVCCDGGVRVLDPRWIALRRMFDQAPASRSLAHDLAYHVPQYQKAFLKRGDEPVWGLSVVLWELLTGYRLFRRESLVGTLHALTKAEIVDPRELNLRVPDKLARWLTETLRHPERRSLSKYWEELTEVGHGSVLGGTLALEEWMMDLGLAGGVAQSAEESRLDALLEGDALVWSSDEASTTYTSGPPSIPDIDPPELSWLEDDTPVSVPPTVTESGDFYDEPTRPFSRGLVGATALLLSLWIGREVLLSLAEPPSSPNLDRSVSAAPPLKQRAADRLASERLLPTAQRFIEVPEVLIDAELERTPKESESLPKPGTSRLPTDRSSKETIAPSDERSEFGTLVVAAPAPVVSSIGGRVVGTGSFQTRLPVGDETVSLSWPGEPGHEVQIRIKPGAVTKMEVSPDL